MINTSDLFREKLGKGEKLYEVVDITFADGTEKRLENEIMLNGGEFSDCTNSSSFPVGNTICKSMKLSLDNTADQWRDYYFFKAKVTAFLKMVFSDGKTETIKKGTYTITTPEQYGEILEFTGLDDMYKANDTYTSKLQLPQDAFTLLRDACATIGIPMGFSSMVHGDVIVRSIPDNMTFRQLIGWIAMLDSANARIDVDGNLQFIQWDFASVSVDYGAEVDSDGYVSFGKTAISSDEYIAPEGGWYVDSDGYLTLREGIIGNPQRFRDYISSPTLSSDDIIITGIKLKNSENSVMYGKDGYVLEMQNEIVGDADLQTVASWIGDSLIGARFRSLSGDLVYNPLSEFGDMAFTYDRKGNKYITPITDISSSLNGITHIKTKAEDPVRGSSKFLSSADKALLAAKKLIRKETKARELAVDNLQKALKDGSGMYETNVLQDDGSTITYLHDKPTLEESKNIIKLTSNAIGVSNDGGKTYPYGFILNGSLITRLLYAEGINADYIQFGTLRGIKLEAVTGDITGEFTSASTNSWGKEYVKIKDAIITAGLDGTQKSLIDMVAQYEDGLHLVIKNDTEINIEAPVLKILTDILNIGDGKISITQKSLAEAQVNVTNTDISGRLVASGGGNFGLYNVTTRSWVIKSDKTGIAVLPATTITEITTMLGDAGVAKNLHVGKEAIIDGKTTINNDLEVSGSAVLGSVDVGKNEHIAGNLEVVGAITNHEKINVTKSDLSEAQIDISNSDISGRLTASAAKNFGLYHITFSKWLIRMGSDGNAYLLDTIFNGTVTFNKGTAFAGTATFSKPATFDATASFKKPPKLYNLTHVTSGNHLVMASDGASIAYLGSSSLRYKDVQGAVEEADLESLYQIKVVWAKYKNEYLDASDERYGKEMPMFLAEDIDQHFPLAVDHDEQGRAENWNYRVMIPCMFAMLKNEHEKVKELQSELESIKTELTELKKFINQYIVRKEV